MDAAIEVQGLVRTFKQIHAVDGIDLRVEPGEIYGFLGPNGAGKSTTVLILTTLLPPTAGSARVGGFDVVADAGAVRGLIGAALQDVALDAHLTGREHLLMQSALHGIAKVERRARAEELLDRVGLTDAADRRVGGYSGGMKRRLDLALALVHRPRILFLDEPTTGLDIQSRHALWAEVAKLARDEGVTVFLTTQYLEEADELADRVAIIHRGKIVAEGSPAALKAAVGRPRIVVTPEHAEDRPKIEKVLTRFGEAVEDGDGTVGVRVEKGANALADVVRALGRARVGFADLELHHPTLDDVFLTHTGMHLEGAAEETAS